MSDYGGRMAELARQSRHTTWDGDGVHGHHPRLTPVWVRLDAVYARRPDAPHRVAPSGLDMEGEVSGLLSTWFETARGNWMGIVTFRIPYADGREQKLTLRDQLVPDYALRKRTENPDAPL